MKIFNGTNHDLKIFANNGDFSVTRKGEKFLVNPYAQPAYIIPQQKPLSVHSAPLYPLAEYSETGTIFLPEFCYTPVDFLPDYQQYDLIACSTLYAQFAIQAFCNNPNYLDRLYTPVCLFSVNPDSEANAKKVGTAGFRKVIPPFYPKDYVQFVRNGLQPSKIGVEACLNLCKPNVCEYGEASYIAELTNYLVQF